MSNANLTTIVKQEMIIAKLGWIRYQVVNEFIYEFYSRRPIMTHSSIRLLIFFTVICPFAHTSSSLYLN